MVLLSLSSSSDFGGHMNKYITDAFRKLCIYTMIKRLTRLQVDLLIASNNMSSKYSRQITLQ